MKSFLFSICVAGCIVLPSNVFAHPEGGLHHGRRAEMMKKGLGLTDEQAKQVRDIFQSTHGRCIDKPEAERADCREKLRTERRQQLAQVLSPEQMQKLQELKEKRR